MNDHFEIIDVNMDNVEKTGFFCYMSKRKSPGYRQKYEWLEKRFAEGMKIKMVHEVGGRNVGFIEYTPGEHAWRALHAPGYLVIHCIWVAGKGKKKGYGSRLLAECLEDAHAQGKYGVAMVTSSGNWLAGKKLLLNNSFEAIAAAPMTFDLLVKRFGDAPLPAFPEDWDERLANFGSGLTIVRTAQCPYIENATRGLIQSAHKLGIPARVYQMETAKQVQGTAPCAYGVFGIVYDGRLLGYHYLGQDQLEKKLHPPEFGM